MQRLSAVFLALVLIAISAPAFAQEMLKVPFDTARIYWDNPNGSTPRWHLINCGGEDVRLDMPATSIAVKAVAPAPGVYVCTVKAANEFGTSLPATSPQFEAGRAPDAPTGLNIKAD